MNERERNTTCSHFYQCDEKHRKSKVNIKYCKKANSRGEFYWHYWEYHPDMTKYTIGRCDENPICQKASWLKNDFEMMMKQIIKEEENNENKMSELE